MSDEFARLIFFHAACLYIRRRRRGNGRRCGGRGVVVAGYCALHQCKYTLILFFFRVSQNKVSTFLSWMNFIENFEVCEFSFLDEMNLHYF